ncbi:MAG: hypothetical protein [Bacteriophage sp.]|jgi:hypothetical protein|nr:MAG: hypothetical protein [Bacteriophage sp.]
MNVQEFSNTFDTLLQPYITKDINGNQNNLAFDEYEKSVFLTKAQEQIVLELYQELEQSEEVRKYLSNLIKTDNYVPVGEQDETLINDNFKSYKVEISNDILFMIYEQCTLSDENNCINNKVVSVVPTIHDDLDKVLKNPFKSPNSRKVIRLDFDNKIELISKYNISNYKVRYLKKPNPIILVALEDNLSINNGDTKVSNGETNPILHERIVQRAVQLAVQSKVKSNNA